MTSEILGETNTIPELLTGVRYSNDYYQGTYKWHYNQIHEVVDDLIGKFIEKRDLTHACKIVTYYHRSVECIWIADNLPRETGA